MTSKGDLIFHLAYLEYMLFLGKFNTLKIVNWALKEQLSDNKSSKLYCICP